MPTIKQCYFHLRMGWTIPKDFTYYGQLAADLHLHLWGKDADLSESCRFDQRKQLEKIWARELEPCGIPDGFVDIFTWRFRYIEHQKRLEREAYRQRPGRWTREQIFEQMAEALP